MSGRKDQFPICPICASSIGRVLFAKEGRDFVACKDCGLIYLHPQPTDEELASIYSEQYYESWGLRTDFTAVERMKVATFAAVFEKLEQFTPPGKVLDIGCAAGFSLEAAIGRGWDAYGVELSSYSAELARQRFGASRLFNGRLEDARYQDCSFDAVLMSDLVEHVKDLGSFFKEVWRIVKPGGAIAIVTPNAASLSRKLMGRRWPHFKLEHLYYFSPANIDQCLANYGFEPIYQASALKALNLSYTVRQFTTYPLPVITPVVRMAMRLLPASLVNRNIMVHTGELLVIARKVR